MMSDIHHDVWREVFADVESSRVKYILLGDETRCLVLNLELVALASLLLLTSTINQSQITLVSSIDWTIRVHEQYVSFGGAPIA
jgi:hypothetical protein